MEGTLRVEKDFKKELKFRGQSISKTPTYSPLIKSDYQCFGDVLAFDTTYRKNKYRRPLVIFSGCNHHRQTCIFGFALVEDERTATYMWLLQNFLEVMLNKSPSVVVTDGDEAMKAAI
ncbi:hypothetical protein AHAS_Ahas06G0164400 [Arachis hypogaea]